VPDTGESTFARSIAQLRPVEQSPDWNSPHTAIRQSECAGRPHLMSGCTVIDG
jgi:hypothetical protein